METVWQNGGGGIWEPKGPMEIIDAQGNGKPYFLANQYLLHWNLEYLPQPHHGRHGKRRCFFGPVDKGQNWTQLATDQNFRTIYRGGVLALPIRVICW